MKTIKFVVGMSGGVDSSVTALLLKQQGYDVIGLFMKNWEDDDDSEYCSSRQDLIDAVSVADTIGIPIEAVNFAKEYKDRVFSYFLREYEAGRTPNPDILCNPRSSSRPFSITPSAWARTPSPPAITRKVREPDGLFQLLKADDDSKDQSYFLHRLNQHATVAMPCSRWATCSNRKCATSPPAQSCPITRRRTAPASASSASARSANS